MANQNKAQQVRAALELTETEAGKIFTRNEKAPYQTWHRWEISGRWPAPVEGIFDAVLNLVEESSKGKAWARYALRTVLKSMEI